MTPEDRARQLSPGGWGRTGSAVDGPRYAKPLEHTHRKPCGFCAAAHPGQPANPATHAGFANGVALCAGCELCMARWVRGGPEAFGQPRHPPHTPCRACPDSRYYHLNDTGPCQHEGCRCESFVEPD